MNQTMQGCLWDSASLLLLSLVDSLGFAFPGFEGRARYADDRGDLDNIDLV